MERWAHLSSQRQDPHLDLSYIGISSENIGGSPDLLVQAQQVQLAPLSQQTGSSSEEPSCPSTPSSPSSSIDSHSGFYSLVEDPSSPEAELNTAWMVSAQRQNQLATLKEERAFKLQTYSSSRRPRSLFPEQLGGQDAHQQEELKAGVEVLVQEEQRRLRQEIIRSQAPRKKTWTRDLDLDMGSRRLLNGLSLVYSKPEPLAPPAAGTVDKAQINFNAARQQFLRMELQDQQPNLLESLSPSKTRPRPSLGVASLEQQENRVQLDQDIAGRDQFDLHRKDSSWSQDLVAIKTTSLNAGPMSSRSTRDPETPIRQKIWLDQKCKEKLSSPHWLKSNDDTIQVQVTSSHLNSLSNPGPVHKEVQTGSKNQRRDSGILRLLSLEAPQKLKDGLDDRFSSPCCPHRHSEETELLLSQRTSAAPLSSSIQETKGIYQDRLTSPFSHVLRLSPPSSPGSWRGNLESNGLQSRGPGTSSFIQQEIEESLRREQELRELRLSRTQLKSFADPLVEQTTKEASRPAETRAVSSPSGHPATSRPTSSFTQTRSSSFSPSSSSPASPFSSLPSSSSPSCLPSPTPAPLVVRSVPPVVGGLTETLLQDYQERQVQLRLEESSYAGILPVDNVNHEVVESTRVIRHKNQRALRWEAGDFVTQEDT